MKAAAIDVGTNSVLLALGEKTADGSIRLICEAGSNPRLGEGFGETGNLRPDGMERTIDAIGKLLGLCREHGAEQVRVVGTSAIREAANGDRFIELVRERLGVELQPISGHDEARLSFSAIALDPVIGGFTKNQLVVDVGGGSTEIIFGHGFEVGFVSSVKAGAVRFTDRFLKGPSPSPCQLVDAAVMAERLLGSIAKLVGVGRFVAVGGSAVNIARVWQEIPLERTDEVHGLRMTYRNLRETIDLLVSLTPERRRQLVGLEPERADIILAGAIIMERALAISAVEEMTISTRGLRHGVLYELLGTC